MFRLSKINIFVVLFFAKNLCLADYSGTVITPENEITFSQKNGYDVIQIENQGGIIDSVGAPQIPFKEFKYLIPYDVEVENLIINSFNEVEIEGSYYLYPTQPEYPLDYGPDPPFMEPDSVIYHQTEKYPFIKAELIVQNTSFGYKIATIRFYPIRYVPAQIKLYRLSTIDFTLVYATIQILDELPERRSSRSQKTVEAFIKSLVENPDDFGIVTGGPNQIVEESSETENLELTPFPTLEGDIVDYLIITNDSLTEEFQRLADWKTKKGVPTLVVTVDWITANYPGCDTAEKIRNYLKDVNRKWALIYVLLGGDVNVVPARYSYSYSFGGNRVTDLYYTDLAKTRDPILDP